MQVSRVRVMLLRAILEQASGLGAIAAHQPSDTSEVSSLQYITPEHCFYSSVRWSK